jgi:hypothetical protein
MNKKIVSTHENDLSANGAKTSAAQGTDHACGDCRSYRFWISAAMSAAAFLASSNSIEVFGS